MGGNVFARFLFSMSRDESRKVYSSALSCCDAVTWVVLLCCAATCFLYLASLGLGAKILHPRELILLMLCTCIVIAVLTFAVPQSSDATSFARCNARKAQETRSRVP